MTSASRISLRWFSMMKSPVRWSTRSRRYLQLGKFNQRVCSSVATLWIAEAALMNSEEWNQPFRSCCFMTFSLIGGGCGIWTHGPLSRSPVFKTGAINRSAKPPWTLAIFCDGRFNLQKLCFRDDVPTSLTRIGRISESRQLFIIVSDTGSRKEAVVDQTNRKSIRKDADTWRRIVAFINGEFCQPLFLGHSNRVDVVSHDYFFGIPCFMSA